MADKIVYGHDYGLVASDREAQNAAIETTRAVLQQVVTERIAQDLAWGEQNHDHMTWSAIEAEELGEAAQAALKLKFGSGMRATGYRAALREELIQVAAVAVVWIESLDRQAARDD